MNQEEMKIQHSFVYVPLVYLTGLIIGVLLDAIYPWRVISDSVALSAGLILVIVAPLIILWSQRTSAKLRKGRSVEEVKLEHFCQGPYCYSRNPTYLGLFFLSIGFGFLTNAIIVIITSVLAFLMVNFFFLKREENLIEKKIWRRV